MLNACFSVNFFKSGSIFCRASSEVQQMQMSPILLLSTYLSIDSKHFSMSMSLHAVHMHMSVFISNLPSVCVHVRLLLELAAKLEHAVFDFCKSFVKLLRLLHLGYVLLHVIAYPLACFAQVPSESV